MVYFSFLGFTYLNNFSYFVSLAILNLNCVYDTCGVFLILINEDSILFYFISAGLNKQQGGQKNSLQC